MIWTGGAILPLRVSCPHRDLFLIREQLWRSSAGAAVKIFETRHPNPANSSSGVEVRTSAVQNKRDELNLHRDMFRPRFSRWGAGRASPVGSLRPIHGTPACQLAPRKLSAPHVRPPRDPTPSPKPCTHMALEGCPPRTKEWGLLWRTGKQTFLLQWREWPAGSTGTL